MKKPTPQALKAAKVIAISTPYSVGTIAHRIDLETKLPELLEVAQAARELCKVLYLQTRYVSPKIESSAGRLDSALGRLDL